jgi:hypothetical protein
MRTRIKLALFSAAVTASLILPTVAEAGWKR